MPIILTFTDASEVVHPDAYHDVHAVTILTRDEEAHINVFIHKSAVECTGNKRRFEERRYVCDNQSGIAMNFDTYFSDGVLRTSGLSVTSQAESYLLNEVSEYASGVQI